MPTLRCLLVVLPALAVTMVRAEPAITVKTIELKQQAATDTATIATIPVQTSVDLVVREGAWVQLRSGSDLGWAKLFDVRLAGSDAAAPKSGAQNNLAQTLNLAAGNRPASVTTGVRGLDADMLAKATPNPAEFATLVSYAATKERAQAFAAAGKLGPRTVELLK